MKDSVRLGRIGGVRVGLNWSLVVVAVLLALGLAHNRLPFDAPGYSSAAYNLVGALTAVALLVGVLLHEFGHAFVARRAGLGVDGITLSWMGGVTRIEGDSTTPATEFAIAVVGPAVSLALGGVFWLARAGIGHGGSSRLAVASLGWLAVINVILGAFNLIPAAPLDGGRVLHAAVWAATKNRWRAARLASQAGMVLGGGVIGYGLHLIGVHRAIDGVVIGAMGWWLLASARREMQTAAVRYALDGTRIGDLMRPVAAGPGWLSVDAFLHQYAIGRPQTVFLLEQWGGGYSGVVSTEALTAVPFSRWGTTRAAEVATPVRAAIGAAATDDALETFTRTDGRQVVLVIAGGHTIGAVLPADVDALLRHGRRPPFAGQASPPSGRLPAGSATR